MELKNLMTFQTILEEGSFTAAADKLGYTQSTITFQIDQLEQALSMKLFERIGRKMVLTAAGKELIPYVAEVLSSVDKLYCVGKEVQDCEGALHIGVAETFLCYKLPDLLKEFIRQAPKAKLFIHSMNCYEIRNQLVDGTLDVGIFYSDIGGIGDNLILRDIGSYPISLVASPSNAEKFSDFTTPGQQIQIPLIINEPNCIFRQIFEGYLKERGICLDHTIELGSIETIKQLVISGLGISFLPRFTVERELQNGSLAEIPTNVRHRDLTIVCAHHKNKWISPLLRLFCNCISDAS